MLGLFAAIKQQLIYLGILAVTLLVFYLYWSYSQDKINSLAEANKTFKSAITTQNTTIDEMKKSFVFDQSLLNSLNDKYSSINDDSAKLKETFEIADTDVDTTIIEANYNKNFNAIIDNINQVTKVKK